VCEASNGPLEKGIEQCGNWEYCYEQFHTVTSGECFGGNWTFAKMAIGVVNTPDPSTGVYCDGSHLKRLIWTSCQRFTQRVHPSFQIRHLCLQLVNSILPKYCFRQPIIHIWIVCSLQFRLIYNLCLTSHIMYFCVSGLLIIPIWAWRSARCHDYQSCSNWNCWHSIDANSHDVAVSMWLLFLSVNAGNSW
jgi:hypothetical protein